MRRLLALAFCFFVGSAHADGYWRSSTTPITGGTISGVGKDTMSSDAAARATTFAGANAYSQATVNTTGGAFGLSPGIGRRIITPVSFGDIDLGVDTVTITVVTASGSTDNVGTATAATQDATNFIVATSNAVTATNICTWVEQLAGVSGTASGDSCYITLDAATYSVTLATTMLAGEGTVTSGTDGALTIVGGSGTNVLDNVVIGSRTAAAGTFTTVTPTTGITPSSAGGIVNIYPVSATASYFRLLNATGNSGPSFRATGGSGSADMTITAGSSILYLNNDGTATHTGGTFTLGGATAAPVIITGGTASGKQFTVTGTNSSVNWVDVAGGATTVGPTISAQGETNVPLNATSKGTSPVNLQTAAGTTQFQVLNTASAARYITVTGSAAGNPTINTTAGDLAITPATVTAGSATATSFIPSSATVPSNGMYLSAANTLAWATNSALRMTLDATGQLGVGVVPVVKLHSYIAASGVACYAGSSGCFESNTHNYVNILAPDGSEKGLMFGDPNSAIHAGIVYDVAGGPAANTLSFRVGGNANVMGIGPVNVGIGIGLADPSSKLDVTTTALGVTQTTTSGVALVNTTAAAAGAQQISPALRWSGKGWKTDATAASQAVDFYSYVTPVEGAANPTGYWSLMSSINGGAYTERLQVNSIGTTTFGGLAVMKGYAIASLPTGVNGAIAHVTDQTSACPAKGVAPTAGGALICPVFYNGSAWVGT